MSKTAVGGQALIEGVLMRSGNRIAMTFRAPEGNLITETKTIQPAQKGIWTAPVFRGLYALFQSFKIGMNALNRSSEVYLGEEQDTKFEKWLKKHFKEKASNLIFAMTLLVSLGFAFLMFSVAPTFLASFLKKYTINPVLLSLLEGLIKVSIFIIYLVVISRLKDIKRVFQFHGAEHKAVYTYEAGEQLTVENARTKSRLHPRCGTSFIFFVLALSILFFSFISFTSVVQRALLKLLFLPVVAGISYEVLKFTAKETALVRFLRFPGLMLQKITTQEPDDIQLEVALTALKAAIDDDQTSDMVL